MYKKVLRFILIFILSLTFITNVSAKEKIKLYFFHGDGCPHCAEEEKYLEKVKKKYPDVKIVEYEVWYNDDNSSFMKEVREKMNIDANGVPLTIIGGTYVVGYMDTYDQKFDRIINYYIDNSDKYVDNVKEIKEKTLEGEVVDYFNEYDKTSDKDTTISVPFIGKVNLKNIGVASSAMLIGLIDGFNPCAMWVLLFLLSMLIGMKDSKRRWIIGLTFLITSALVYMAIMLSWINLVVSISTSIIFRYLIALVGLIGGVINIRNYLKERKQDDGCTVVDSKKRKKIFTQIKDFTTEKSLILALIGVVMLAVSVNVVELACSAGLPLIFTQILALNNISGLNAFLYTLVYIVFFLLDDIIVFMIAMFTMKTTGISTKYNKYSHLIGGILMLLIGLLLIIKPELLMFNFK